MGSTDPTPQSGVTALPVVVEHTRDDMRRADTTAVGHIAGIAGLAALVGQVAVTLPHPVLVITLIAGLPAVGVLVQAARVLWPRTTRRQTPAGSWVHAAHHLRHGTDLVADYAATEVTELYAVQFAVLASIASRKYRLVRVGTVLLLATLTVLFVALLVGLGTAVTR
jgi:Pycsar effector protein